jgi:hypothetical protein
MMWVHAKENVTVGSARRPAVSGLESQQTGPWLDTLTVPSAVTTTTVLCSSKQCTFPTYSRLYQQFENEGEEDRYVNVSLLLRIS